MVNFAKCDFRTANIASYIEQKMMEHTVKLTKKERFAAILEWFERNSPDPESELDFRNPWELLVAVVLSAQCTDKRVNMVTPGLFEAYPDAASMALASESEIYGHIRSISYPNNKARNLAALARKLSADHDGAVPSDRDLLMQLPGVGRKTANVLLAVLFDRPAMAVDTHVFRVSRRIGLASMDAATPLAVEKELTAQIPARLLPRAHHWLLLHGRYVCTARAPKCESCGISAFCEKKFLPCGIAT